MMQRRAAGDVGKFKSGSLEWRLWVDRGQCLVDRWPTASEGNRRLERSGECKPLNDHCGTLNAVGFAAWPNLNVQLVEDQRAHTLSLVLLDCSFLDLSWV